MERFSILESVCHSIYLLQYAIFAGNKGSKMPSANLQSANTFGSGGEILHSDFKLHFTVSHYGKQRILGKVEHEQNFSSSLITTVTEAEEQTYETVLLPAACLSDIVRRRLLNSLVDDSTLLLCSKLISVLHM